MRRVSIVVLRTLLLAALTGGSVVAQAPKKAPARKPHATAPKRSLLDPASLNEKAPETYKAKFATTKGDFVIEVRRASSPLGADRFYNLVKNGFYNDASFFRVLQGFVVQFGISAKPEVSKAWLTASFPDDPVTE